MIKKVNFYLYKFLFIFFLFNIFLTNVSADIQIIDYSTVSSFHGVGSENGCNRNCFHKDNTFYDGFMVAFRFTLVDSNGNKVAETNSVDYTGRQNVYDDFKSGKYVLVNGNTYKYRYGQNAASNFQLIYIDNGPTRANIDNKTFQSYVVNHGQKLWEINGESVNFLDLFLHHCGYLKNEVYPRLENSANKKKLQELQENNYYIIIEPTIFLYNLSSKVHYYGTVTEFSENIYSAWGSSPTWPPYYNLARDIRHEFGCYLTTTRADAKNAKFGVITKDATPNCAGNGPDYGEWYQDAVGEIVDKGFGTGVGLLKIDVSDLGDPDPEEIYVDENIVASFKLDLCDSGDGIISFDTYNGGYLNSKFLTDSEVNGIFKGTSDDIYCYDTVNYDFSDTINDLSQTRRLYTNVSVIPGNATVTRICKVPSNNGYDVKNDLGTYKTNNIDLNVYGNTYTFVPNLDDVTIDTRTIYGSNNYFIYKYEINFKYEINDVIQLNNSTDISITDGSISFSDVRNYFGRSNNLLSGLIKGDLGISITDTQENQLTNTITYTTTNYTYSWTPYDGATFLKNPRLKYTNEKLGFSCNFNYKVERTDIDAIFRTISLDNPFPARDGSARLPGINWLNEENYVYDSIINNRGVSGDEVYNLEPMYSITLDPSTMIKIRSYNKTHSYSDLSLKCDDERECYSTFLRDNISSSNLNGVCVLTNETDDTKIRNAFNATDNNDIKFYTCANKTYKSGGPVDE